MSAAVATLAVSGKANISAWCVGLDYGPTVTASESESSQRAAFYPKHVTSSSFSITLKFSTYASWRRFNEWLIDYSTNHLGKVVTFSVPSSGFLRKGIPQSGYGRGDDVAAVAREVNLRVEGTTDPVSPGFSGTTSEPTIPDAPTIRYFYPTGVQASGQGSAEEDAYDVDPGAPPVPEEYFGSNGEGPMRGPY